MKQKLKNCGVTVNNQDELMTRDHIFVTRDIYKENCSSKCKLKSTCGILIGMLANGKHEEALKILKNSRQWESLSK